MCCCPNTTLDAITIATKAVIICLIDCFMFLLQMIIIQT